MEKPKAVFLDRDGIINEEIWDYIKHPSEFRLLPRSPEAIRFLNENGIRAIVVSNQGGVAKGYCTEEVVREVHSLMEKELGKAGAHLDAIYYCPHHPEGTGIYRRDCNCRKPKIGMLEEAASSFNLELKDCWMIGDKMTDIEAGIKAGCKTILVLTGYGKKMLEDRQNWKVEPDLIKEDIYEAVISICC